MPPSEPPLATEALARALYLRHGPPLQRWLRRRCDDPQVAEEVLQEAILSAWRRYEQYDPERGSERAWLFGIARNAANTRDRGRRRHLRVVPTDPTTVGSDEAGTGDDDLARVVDRTLVVDAMSALSPDHRAVIVAAYFERRTTREMSALLGIPEGTVKSRLHHGLRALRANLEEREVL
jgi:RNA polymerase sigma-70 factor (ECF subfamily)